MASVNKASYFLNISPELRSQIKAMAALNGKSMKEWITEAIIARLEDEIDASGGMQSLADPEGTLSLDEYLRSRISGSKQAA